MRLWVALAAAVLTACGAVTVRAADPPPLQIRLGPPLPNGRLLAISHVGKFFAFVVEDSMTRRGSTADVWFYEIVDPPMPIGRQITSQVLEHMRFDCKKRVVQELGHWRYDNADGDVWGVDSDQPSAPRPMVAGDHEDLRSRYVCDGMPLALEVTGRAAARALVLRVEAAGD